GLQPLQARFQRARQVAARVALGVDVRPGRIERLGGDDQVLARAAHQPAENLLRLALAVLVGGVAEVDPEVAHCLEHLRGGRVVAVAAEGHGAEAELRDLHAGAAEELVLQTSPLSRFTALSGLVSTSQEIAFATSSRARAVENWASITASQSPSA